MAGLNCTRPRHARESLLSQAGLRLAIYLRERKHSHFAAAPPQNLN